MSIEIKRLSKSFRSTPVLDEVSVTVEPGEILFVIGASGTGKSVLMRHVIGLLRPDSGEVWVDGTRVDGLCGRDLYSIRHACGFVFQSPALLDFLTLEGNVAMPLRKRRGLDGGAAIDLARLWLAEVGISGSEAVRLPSELGAGVCKRASIARVLALEPRYVIYDEPTTGLDPINARRIDELIGRMAHDKKVTTVVVSHDLRSIFGLADRIVFLYRGRVHAAGSPGDLARSEDPVLRQFLAGRADGPMDI